MEIVSIIIAILSAVISIVTFVITVQFEKKKITLEAVNLLQNEVLDKFVSIKKENAELVVGNLDNKKCKEAYNDYRALVARLDHFAVGVNKHIYSFGIVNSLVGNHIVHLYNKVEPIINEANKKEKCILHYFNLYKLVKNLKRRHKKEKL